MREKNYLKEKAQHGTALIPLSIYPLNFDKKESHYFYLHWHEEMELVYILSGGIIYTIDDKEYPLVAGQGAFINSNRLHSARSLGHMPCEGIVIVFHPTFFDPSRHKAIYNKFISPIISKERSTITFFSEDVPWQKSIIDDLIYLSNHRNKPFDEWEMMITSKLYAILHHLYENSTASEYNRKDHKNDNFKRLKGVLEYIDDHFANDISLDELSAIIPMSNGQLCRVFKEAIGMPPIAYLLQYRILKSCELLRKDDMKISEVARMTGFNNVSHYNRAFLKQIGCAPSVYRQKGHPTIKP